MSLPASDPRDENPAERLMQALLGSGAVTYRKEPMSELGKTDQSTVLAAVKDERKWQDQKWGTIAEHPHEVGSWLTIMRQLLNDAEREYMSQRGDLGALHEIRKVCAVGVACMEQHGSPFRKWDGSDKPKG